MEERQIMQEKPPKAEPVPELTDEMSFLDHLEELRWRIIKGVAGIGVGMLIAYIFSDFLIDKVLLGPVHKDFITYKIFGMHATNLSLQSRSLPGQFFTFFGTLIVVGVIIGSPILIYQIWSFVSPALNNVSKWKTRGNTLFITAFFIAGVCFGYFILVPFALQFFNQFSISDIVRNDFDINAYFSSITMWILSCGVVFELPVTSYFLAKFGLLTPDFLKKYRRHALVISFALAAFLTPPDPVSQILVAIPLVILYQLSIYVSKLGKRSRERSLKKAMGNNAET